MAEFEEICNRFFAACEEFNAVLSEMREAKVVAKMTIEWSGKEVVSQSADIGKIIPDCAEQLVRITAKEWTEKQIIAAKGK